MCWLSEWDENILRLSNIVLDITGSISASATSFEAEGIDNSTREIKDDVYPFYGDVKIDNMHIFQSVTQVHAPGDSSANGPMFINSFITGTKEGSVNSAGALKMTGALAAHIDSIDASATGIDYKWNVLMIADSIFGG